MPTPRIRVLCVDDHRMVLEGIVMMIDRQADMEVVGSTVSGREAIEMFRRCQPDVTVMDLQMPDTNGLDAIRVILNEYPSARIMVLTMYQGDEDIYRALQAGAATYLLKDALSHELVRMVREVHAGRRPLPPNVASLLAARAAYPPLTSREVEVMELLAKGMRNKEIAYELGITEKTAAVHVKNILAKFDVHDRAAAINVAIHRGIVHIQ
jgi:DNA-binding NarL/FixJ family response regulator